MCGRIVWIWDPETRALVRKIVDDPEQDPEVRRLLEKERYNVPPASHLPVVDGRPAREGGRPEMAVARWGFPIPRRPNGVFNTRIETAAESPMWRGLLGRSHCLFVVAGFYEWRRSGKARTPFFIHRQDEQPMLLGGLIQTRSWEGGPHTFGSVVTCAPNAFMEALHDRMPVVVETRDAMRWLGADRDAAFEVAEPAGDVLTRHQVGPAVNDTKNDRPDLLEPVGQQGLGAFG